MLQQMVRMFIYFLIAEGTVEVPKTNDLTAIDQKKSILNKLRPSVAMITTKVFYNADRVNWFSSRTEWSGTAFIIDKKKGIAVTNKHVVGDEAIATYELEFSNGTVATAEVLYKDPCYDFAFLKINPSEIPEDVKVLNFATDDLSINEQIYAITNMWGSNFSILDGTIISLYENTGPFDDQSIEYSGMTLGGASGSPVINSRGDLVGIIYGGRFVTGMFLPIAYIRDAYNALKNDQVPTRRTLGFFPTYTNLNHVQEKKLVPETALSEYRKKFPKANNKIMKIKLMQSDSSASRSLSPGDIIWSINGEILGPRLYRFHELVNSHENIILGVYRNGQFIEINLKSIKIELVSEKMLIFSGATFSSLKFDRQVRVNLNEPDSVFLRTTEHNSDFKKLITDQTNIVQIKKIDEFTITDLNSLKKIIPEIRERKLLMVEYIDYGIDSPFGDFGFLRTGYPRVAFVKHFKEFDSPKFFKFNSELGRWIHEDLEAKK